MAKGCVRPINLHFCLYFVNSKFIVDWLPKSVYSKENWQKLTPKEKSTLVREWLWAWFSESNNYGIMIARSYRYFVYMVRIRQFRYRRIAKSTRRCIKNSMLMISVIFKILLNSIVCFLHIPSSYFRVRGIIKVSVFLRF